MLFFAYRIDTSIDLHAIVVIKLFIKMRKIFFLALMFSLFTMGEIMAQNEPYNIARALECLENNDRAGAVDYLKKEIAADSKSGKAYDIDINWRALLFSIFVMDVEVFPSFSLQFIALLLTIRSSFL